MTSPESEHAAGIGGLEALRLLSIHHRVAPLAQLERMALSPEAAADLRRRLAERGIRSVVLATCNRTELYWCTGAPGDERLAERELLASGRGPGPPASSFVRASGADAAIHLFRVAAGLESLMVGEAEILGQVGGALEAAEADGGAGSLLAGLFRCAMRFGRRARAETRIGAGALSVASAAVQLIGRMNPERDLSRSTVLVIGAGTTGSAAGRYLRSLRVGRLVMMSHDRERAARAAETLGGPCASIEELERWLPEADAVLAVTRTGAPVVTAEQVGRAKRARDSRPMLLLDLSLPRAIEPQVSGIEGVALHDLSRLEEVVAENRARRERELPKVEALLRHELQALEGWTRERAAGPLVKQIRVWAESIRSAELERALAGGPLGSEGLDRLTRRLVDRILHGPTEALKRGDLALDERRVEELARLFGLPPGEHHANP